MTKAEAYEQYAREFEIRQQERVEFARFVTSLLETVQTLPIGEYLRLTRAMKREATGSWVLTSRDEWEEAAKRKAAMVAAAVGDAG